MTDAAGDRLDGEFKPPANDPWKGLRGVMAGTLILEAIVVLLALPIVGVLGRGLTSWAAAYVIVLALLMIIGSGLQRRPWAMWLNLALQVAMIAGWVVHIAVGVLGLFFAAVWGFILYLRRDVAQRMRRGLLPGQRD